MELHWVLKALSVAILCAPSPAARPQESLADLRREIPVDELRADLALLRRALEEAHPGRLRFTSQDALDAAFSMAEQALEEPETEIEFYSRISVILATIRDGHTRSLLSEATMEVLSSSAPMFPLRLRFLAGRAFVVAAPEAKLPLGAEILAIDGQPMSAIVAELFRHLPGDGDIETGKYWALTDSFGLYYHLFFSTGPAFEVGFRSLDGALPKTTRLSAIRADALSSLDILPGRGDAPSSKPLRLDYLPDRGAARLRIATFNADEIGEAHQDLPAFLAEAFADLRERDIQDLILDLRGNDGGRDAFGSLLCSYLLSVPFRYYDRLELASDHYSFLEFTNMDSAALAGLFAGLVRSESGELRRPESAHANLALQEPRPRPYRGRVWVLVNGASFSTTAELCSILHHHRRAQFIGEEIGGAYGGNTSGSFLILTLPASRIRIAVPLVSYVLAVPAEDRIPRGVRPDCAVQPTIDDVLRSVDRELETTLDLIEEARKKRDR